MPDSLRDPFAPATFAAVIAVSMEENAAALAGRWLDRLLSLIPVAPNQVFRTDTILDHVPVLIAQIARYIATPEADIVANTFVVAKATELGELRHAQDASVHQLLREYEVLRSILEHFVVEQTKALQVKPDVLAALSCVRRINQAVAALTHTTV